MNREEKIARTITKKKKKEVKAAEFGGKSNTELGNGWEKEELMITPLFLD